MKLRMALVVLAAATLCYGQHQTQVEVGMRPGSSRDAEPARKATPEQLERGRQMLQLAEVQAAGLEGGMRSYALLQVARAYQPTDKKKALALLEDALAATRAIDDDNLKTRFQLQKQILQEMVPLAPQRVDELLTQVEPQARASVLSSLLQYYEKQKELGHAVEVLYRIAQESEMPYGAALRVMQALPPERAADAQQLFAVSLASFQDRKRDGACMGDCDFVPLILRFWNRLPKEAVLDAIHAVLKDARDRGQKGSFSMASDQGAVAFNSQYEFRLFQVLPVLRQLDESEAKKLLEEFQQVQTLLAKYPQGTDSLQPPDAPEGGRDRRPGSSTSFMVSSDGPGGGGRQGPGPQMPAPLEMQQVSKIAAEAEKHPRDALAMCAGISNPGLRSQALLMIARSTWKNDSSIAREALQKFIELTPKLEIAQQVMSLSTAANIYLNMGETDNAKGVIEKGLAAAETAYKKDSNADDPNKALKAYWPSAEAYRGMLRLAVRISPVWAANLAKEISDPEMKVVAQIAMAASLLDIPTGSTMIMNANKQGTNMSMSMER
jgi:tetratricopeptide (TPR) repeat protein